MAITFEMPLDLVKHAKVTYLPKSSSICRNVVQYFTYRSSNLQFLEAACRYYMAAW